MTEKIMEFVSPNASPDVVMIVTMECDVYDIEESVRRYYEEDGEEFEEAVRLALDDLAISYYEPDIETVII